MPNNDAWHSGCFRGALKPIADAMRRPELSSSRMKAGGTQASSPTPPSSTSSTAAKLRQAVWLALGVLALGGGWVWFHEPRGGGTASSPRTGTVLREQGDSGPWGRLEYVPILIETPDEFLSITRQAGYDLRWVFQNRTAVELRAVFDQSDLGVTEKTWLQDPRNWNVEGNRIVLTPPPALVLGLSPSARERIYNLLADCGGNPLHEMPMSFRRDAAEEWFHKSGLSPETLAMAKGLLYRRGNALCLSDWPLLLRQIQSPTERLRLVKTTSRQSTLLVRLRVDADSDLEALAQYWGRGGRLKDIRPLLQSLSLVKDPVYLDVVHLLPRFLRARIYTYPFPADANGKPTPNCFWTSMNFHANDGPVDRYYDPESVQQALAEDFFPVEENYALGDVLLLSKPDGTLVHAAVFVADDVVFTKNGAHHTQPWMFEKLDDLAASYPSTTPLKLRAYRRKDM